MKKVLLCCGSGLSSGFMAKNATDAAKKRGLDISVFARSESEVLDYVDDICLVMVGPHFEYKLGTIQQDVEEYNIPVALIDQETYGTLNGDKLLDTILKYVKF